MTVSITIPPDPQERRDRVSLNSVSKLDLEVFKFICFTKHLTCRTHYSLTSSWFPEQEALGSLGGQQIEKVFSGCKRPACQHSRYKSPEPAQTKGQPGSDELTHSLASSPRQVLIGGYPVPILNRNGTHIKRPSRLRLPYNLPAALSRTLQRTG